MKTWTLLIVLLSFATQCSAQTTGENDAEIKRLLNAAFDIWHDNPALFEDSSEPDAIVSDARRFAEFGFFDDAIRVVDGAIAARRTKQAGDAVVALILVLLERGEVERALALIDQFAQQLPDVSLNPSWRDHALEFVVQYFVDHNKPDRALKVVDLMAGKLPKPDDELNEEDKVKWNCYSLIAQTQARNGDPQRGLDLLKSVRNTIPQENLEEVIRSAIAVDQFEWAVPYIDMLPDSDRGSHVYDAFQSAIWGSDFQAAEKIAEYCAGFDPEAAAEFYAQIAFAENDVKATKKWRDLANEACNPLPVDAHTIFIELSLRQGELESAIKELVTIDQEEFYFNNSLQEFLVHAIVRAANEDGQLRANAALQSIEPEWLQLKIMLELATKRLANGNPESAEELVQEVKSKLSSIPIEKLHEFWPGSPHRLLAKFGFYDEAISFLKLTPEIFSKDYQLSMRFQIAAMMLDRGDKEACFALLANVEQVDELPSRVIDGIAIIAKESGLTTAIEILDKISRKPLPGIGDIVWIMVVQGDHEIAEQLWMTERSRFTKGDSIELIESVKKSFFDPDDEYGVGYSLTDLRGLEQIFSTTPELLLPIANGFAELGYSQNVFRIMDSMSDVWTTPELIPLYRMLVETGQLSSVLERQTKLRDVVLENHLSEFTARHHLLTGRTQRAIQAAETIEDKQQKRELLIRCAEQLNSPYLNQLRAIDNWLESIAVIEGDLVSYPVAVETPERTSLNLYSGSSGIMRFYLKMNKVTGDKLYRMKAMRIARTLSAEIPRLTTESDPGFFTGYSGLAMTLLKTWQNKNSRQARKCIDLLRRSASAIDERPEGRAIGWNDSTDIISGSAGIGLFLLEADFRNWQARALAIEAGDGLLASAESVAIGDGVSGLRWRINAQFEKELPNFSHGTAGICYFLAELHSICEINSGDYEFAEPGFEYDGRFGQAALAGARYLVSLDAKYGARGHIPHHFPDGEDLFYLGWCHGPPGTCQLAYVLRLEDESERWKEYSKAATDSLVRAALHQSRTEGFWNNVGLCCGSAGVGSFLVDQSRWYTEPKYLDEAKRIADDILSRGLRGETDDGLPTLCWPSAEHRVRPDFIQTQTGLMQGAAGVGLFLLQLETEHRGDETQFSIFIDLMR